MFTTWINFTLVFVAIGISAYYAIRGRTADRAMMIFNAVVGCLLLCGYLIFFYDYYYSDIMTRLQISMLIIKPIILILLLAFIANILRIGWVRK